VLYVYCCYCYSDQQSVCPTCCPVALTVSPTVQTLHHTIAIVTNSLPYLLPCCTNSKPHSTDGTPHNCQADCCHRLLTLIMLCIYTILRHIMNSKYALADCSFIFSFISNYDRSCVYSSSTVYAAIHTFTNVIPQGTDLSALLVPSDGTNSLTGFFVRNTIQSDTLNDVTTHTIIPKPQPTKFCQYVQYICYQTQFLYSSSPYKQYWCS